MNKDKKKCEWCKKTLPVFGIDRKNGKESFGDWSKRKFHKKCYILYDDEQRYKALRLKLANNSSV